MGADKIVSREMSGLLKAPRPSGGDGDGEDPYCRAFETAGADPLPYRPQDEFRAYSAQPPSPSPSPSPTRNRSRTSASITTKTRFPSLAPTPGSFLVSGDTRAAGAVAHARKTWAPPALRTQAVTSYGAVPDLEVTAPRACCVCWLVSREACSVWCNALAYLVVIFSSAFPIAGGDRKGHVPVIRYRDMFSGGGQ
ncbi:unnamed protein product [Ascophyllum nodosum]